MNTTAWRWFPVGLAASMAVVFLVNFYMVYDALHTFPGIAGEDGFALSNQYKRVLAAAQEQEALGWRIEAEVTSSRFPVLRLTDRDGSPLAIAAIEARAERPIGPPTSTVLAFRPIEAGQFQANTSLFSGQWDIMLTLHADGQAYTATRRVFVK